jgi:serine/threonine protein kinase
LLKDSGGPPNGLRRHERRGRTRTGLLLLTREYAAPEQVRSAPVTTATDIYALGLLLYELLVGRRPFDLRGKTATEIERTICELEGPPNVE